MEWWIGLSGRYSARVLMQKQYRKLEHCTNAKTTRVAQANASFGLRRWCVAVGDGVVDVGVVDACTNWS